MPVLPSANYNYKVLHDIHQENWILHLFSMLWNSQLLTETSEMLALLGKGKSRMFKFQCNDYQHIEESIL
jgi:hypothetical protein